MRRHAASACQGGCITGKLQLLADEEGTGNYAFIRDARFEPARLRRVQQECEEQLMRATEVPASNNG